jgi:hypothetical protein
VEKYWPFSLGICGGALFASVSPQVFSHFNSSLFEASTLGLNGVEVAASMIDHLIDCRSLFSFW